MKSDELPFLSLPETFCVATCYSQAEKMLPFVHTDLLIQYAHEYQQPILHFWTLEKTLVLGMKDLRLPYWDQALTFLREAQINTVVRNAGGLAVLLDQGILNVSLILPSGNNNGLSIQAAYEQYYQWFKQTFAPFGEKITAGEIHNSYCPGTFDFSIRGKKFAGTAQRRLKDATAVMAYLSVNGDQSERGEIVRRFYQSGLEKDFGTDGYPPVDPASMANLDSLYAREFTLSELQRLLQESFTHFFQTELKKIAINPLLSQADYLDQIPTLIERMQKRNEPLQRL